MAFSDDINKTAELLSKIEKTVTNLSKNSKGQTGVFKQYVSYLAEAKKSTEAIQSNLKEALVNDKKIAKEFADAQKVINDMTSETLQNIEARGKIEAKIDRLVKARAKYTGEARKSLELNLKATREEARLLDEGIKRQEHALKLEEQKLKASRESLSVLKKETEKFQRGLDGTFFDPEVGFFGEKKDFDKSVSYLEESMVSVADTFGEALSGNLDSVAKLGIDSLKTGGNKLRDTASNMRLSTGGEGGKLSKVIGTLGKSVAVFAGVASGLFAIFKVMQAIEEAQKGVNKELIEAYGMTDLIVDNAGEVATQIKNVRQSLSDADFANDLGVPLEQARQMVTELNSIGINMRTVNGDVESMKDLTMQLRASSAAIGIGFSDAVGFAQNFREEMGLSVKNGQLLERMSDEFSRIRDLASQSSFSTNRFFQVVQGLTEGIGGMNVRVGEAGALFLKLSKVLGPKAGQQFAQGLTEGFRSEGIQDRMKRIILTGKGKVTQAAMRSARSTFRELGKDEALKDFLATRNISSADDLKKLSDEQVKQIMFDMRAQLGEQGSAKALQFLKARDLAKGGTGNMNDLVMALGEFDMSGTLESQMQQVLAFLGPKGFAGASAAQLEALSNYTGKSLQELMDYRKLDFQLQTEYQKAMELSNNKKLTPAQKKEMLAEIGITDVAINESGQLVSKSGEIIKDIGAFIHAQGATLEKNRVKKVDEMQLLSEIVDATLTSADMINNHLGGLMQQMISPLDYLSSWFGREEDKGIEDRKRIAEELRLSLKDDEDKLADKKKSARAELSKMRLEGATESALKQRDAELKAEIARDKATLELKKKQARYLTSGQSRGVSGTDEEIKRKAEYEVGRRLVSTKHGRSSLKKAGQNTLLLALKDMLGGTAKEADLQKLSDEQLKKLKEKYGLTVQKEGEAVSEHKHEKILGVGDVRHDTKRQTYSITDEEGNKRLIATREIHSQSGKHGGLGRAIDRKVYDSDDLTQNAALIEKSNVRLSEIAEKLDDSNLSDAEISKLETERAQINAKILANSKAYQDATGKTFEEAILNAEKQKLVNRLNAELGGSSALTTDLDRKTALSKLSALKKTMNQDEWDFLREDFRTVYGYDTMQSPNKKYPETFPAGALAKGSPVVLRGGAMTIGQPTDTVSMVDYSKGGGRGGGGGVVNINIYGGDQSKVFKTVKNAISATKNMMD